MSLATQPKAEHRWDSSGHLGLSRVSDQVSHAGRPEIRVQCDSLLKGPAWLCLQSGPYTAAVTQNCLITCQRLRFAWLVGTSHCETGHIRCKEVSSKEVIHTSFHKVFLSPFLPWVLGWESGACWGSGRKPHCDTRGYCTRCRRRRMFLTWLPPHCAL